MAGGDAGSMLKWVTVYDKEQGEIEIPDIDDVLAKTNGGGKDKNNKRLSVERIYQKKSQLEHILLRPDTYIGSVEKVTQSMWVYDDEAEAMVQRDITYVPGLYKIFDEILVNASDNKQRDEKMSTIKIDIDSEANKIKVWNNGKGIPVIEHKSEKMYVPTLIFGHLLTSSNFDDSEKKTTGGRNGYGAKLCNVFSTKFVVETQTNEYKKAFKQVWNNNMSKVGEPKIVASKGEDYTAITFYPDLVKFKMDKLDKDIVDLFTRRAYDIAATCKGVKVILNGKKLPIKNFKDYVELYVKGKIDDNGSPLKVVHDFINPRWEIALTLSEKGFQNVSFVNSIATTKGGRHVDYVADHLVSKLIEVVKKKEKKGGITIKPFQVKNHVWVFVNCLIENPTFDSQTKENMTLQAKQFGSKCTLTEKFVAQVSKCGIVESIMSWMRFKQQAQLNKKMSSGKHSKLKGIPKLDDANDAGTKNSMECTLILTEGDSAKTLAVAGLGVIGRDRYGVFPLRGKVLNVREATHKQIMENAEINNIIKILALRYKDKYDTPESLKMLRYGKIMIMTDQDQDGSHIKGLLINFIHHNWPNLLKQNFLEEFITPIVKVSKGKHPDQSFYSLPEFEEWKKGTDNWHTWKVKYYKGLGTSTSKEAKEYFSAMKRHRIPFRYAGGEDDSSILLAFSKKKIEERKEWLTNWMEERKRRSQLGLPELFLYGKDTKTISYNEFVNRELILFSNMDNERSIPSLVDGFKPGQRKVLFTCLKRNLTKEVKVAQFAGSVAEHSAYHHGEQSLMTTIINLAQNFVGSNNVNLLQPLGQFGTRLHGGKDAASPRYIFTMLSSVTKLIFNPHDDPLLKSMYDDNQRIEPEWYVPILPMVLVNGADGIGTGWSTKIPNHDPREIVNNLLKMMDNEQPLTMLPSFKNFKGTIEQLEDSRFLFNGEVNIIDDQTIEITELPVKTWTQVYKENVLEPMLQGSDKMQPFIQDYKEYHTDTTVRFVVKLSGEKLAQAEEQGLHKVFKLQSPMSVNSMVLFDSNGCIKRYSNVEEILKEFYEVRVDFYRRRKDYLEGMLAAESLKLDNIARFICEKIDGTIVIENKPKKEIIQMLTRRGYDPDPVKTWKEAQDKLQAMEEFGVDDADDSQSTTSAGGGGATDFNYLMSLPLWFLTKEKKDELLKQRDEKAEELYKLKKKSPKTLWRDDLDAFIKELDIVEEKEREEEIAGNNVVAKAAKGGKGRAKVQHRETKPSPMGRRVEPRIDPALRVKAEQAAAKRKKVQEKKEAGLLVNDDSLSIDGSEPKSLAERMGMKSSKLGKGQQSVMDAFSKTKPKKKVLSQKLDLGSDSDSDFEGLANGTEKVSHIKRTDLSPKKPRANSGGKKRARHGSDSELSDSEYIKKSPKKVKKPFDSDSDNEGKSRKSRKKIGSDSDDFELEDDFKMKVEPRSRVGRTKKPTKYNFGAESGEDEDEEEDNMDDADVSYHASPAQATSDIFPQQSDSEAEMISDSESSPIKAKKPAVNTKKIEVLSSGSDYDLSIDEDSPPPKAKPIAAKKTIATKPDSDDIWGNIVSNKPAPKAAEPPKTFSVSDSDDEFDLEVEPAPKKTYAESDSDDDFNPESSPIQKTKAKGKPRKKKGGSDDSDDEMWGARKKKSPKKRAAPRKKSAEDKPKKAAPRKRAPKKKAGSDDESGTKRAPKKTSKKVTPTFSDSEGEDEFAELKSKDSDDDFDIEMSDVAKRATTGRSRKPVQYNFGAPSSDEEGDY